MKPIGYKAFDKGMKCKDFQFAENTEFTHEGDIKICSSGFHYCENPLDILNYYNLCNSDFAEVLEADQKQTHDFPVSDSKVCTNRIKIGVKIDLKAFIKASFDFLWEKCKDVDSGNYSQQASSGDYSKQVSSGYNSKQVSSGYNSKQASSGGYSKQVSSGDYSKQASSGNNSQQASSGDYSQQASSGNNSKQACSGSNSQHEATGENSVIASVGRDSRIKAKKGGWITLAEYDQRGIILFVKSAKIDGVKLKEDTWYILKNKKFTEA